MTDFNRKTVLITGAAHGIGKLAQADGSGVTIARHPQVQQIAVGHVGARQHRRHAAVHGVEAVRGAQKVIWRLGTATDARELGHAVRLDVQFPASLNDGRRDRVMPATGAQGGDAAFVIAARVANLVGGQRGVVQAGFGNVGHTSSFCLGSFSASG